MAKRTQNRGRIAARVAAANPNVASQETLFGSTAGGRWATSMLKKAALEGKALSGAALRTLDTLRHEEWKFFDDALVEEALIRLRGVADLIGAGLVKPVSNALAKMVYGYEKVDFMDPATVSLDGTSRTANDRQEFSLNQLPLPITHKDFFINLRVLAASREKGEALDTTQVRTAGRVVAEKAEDMLFNGGPTFGALPIYGYTTFPDRNQNTFDGGKDWADTSKAGSSYLKDVTAALAALAAKRMYGPFVVYVSTDAGVVIENDYNPGTANTQSIRQRILAVQQIQDIRVADTLATANVIFSQMTIDNVAWIQGDPLQVVQWDEGGGFTINFKAWQIGVPLLRSDAAGRSGVYHLHD